MIQTESVSDFVDCNHSEIIIAAIQSEILIHVEVNAAILWKECVSQIAALPVERVAIIVLVLHKLDH